MEKYLIKFVEKEKYANNLIAGMFFMHSAGYYHKLEQGQGDIREGALSHTAMMHKNLGCPIYCMYIAYEEQCEDGIIWVDKKVLSDFKGDDRHIVIFNFNDFVNRISKTENGKLKSKIETDRAISFGSVIYKYISFDDTKAFFTQNNNDHLFVKHPFFSHQHEFRIVIDDRIGKDESKTFYLKNGLTFSDIATKIRLDSSHTIAKCDEIGIILH